MKYFLSFIFILTLSFQGFSQKKTIKKAKPKTAAVSKNDVFDGMYVQAEPFTVDTLYIYKGKKYVFLVNVDKYSGQGNVTYANPDNTEETELIKNFGKDALQIINISKYTYIIFENKQKLDISIEDATYQALAYWGGKIEDRVQVKEGAKMATEFVSEYLGGNKESSYVINTRKYKKEIAGLENKNKITSKSKEIMNALLFNFTLPYSKLKEDDQYVFKQQKNVKVKTIKSYFIDKKGTKTALKTIELNESGQPALTINFNREGKEDGKKTFIYKDGLLTKILDGNEVYSSISYDDNKMIFTRNAGDATETTIYWLENSKLLLKVYTLMDNDKFAYMNTLAEEKTENNCIVYSLNNKIGTRNCSTPPNSFPFVHVYTSYQDGEVLQYRKSKIEKKSESTFEKYYSDAKLEGEKDAFKLFGTFQLNEYNLVSEYNFKKNKDNESIKVEYTYY